MRYLLKHLHNVVSLTLCVLLGSLAGFDVLTRFVPQAGFVSSLLFITTVCVIFCYAVYAAYTLVRFAGTHCAVWLVVLVFFIISAFVFVAVPLSRGVSGEATQEVTCGIRALQGRWDGWQTTCFLGYPMRQYVVMAIPTVLWGRSVTALHSGVAVLFLAGLIVFLTGITVNGGDLLSVAIAIGGAGLLLHAGFVTHFLFRFEQSIIPLCLSLYITGAYLWYHRTRHIVHLLIAAISIMFAASSYTPALVLWPLAFGASVYLWQGLRRSEKPMFIATLFILTAVFITSLLYRQDLRLAFGSHTLALRLRELWEGVQFMTFKTGYYPYGTVVFKLLMAAGVVLLLFLGLPGQLVVLWILTVIAISILSKGYVWYGVDFRLHRSTVIIPIVITGFCALRHWIRGHVAKIGVIVAAIGIFVSGVAVAYIRLTNLPVSIHYMVISVMRSLPQTVVIADGEDNAIKSIGDEMKYFLPSANVIDDTASLRGGHCKIPRADVIVINAAHPCFPVLQQETSGSSYRSQTISVGEDTYRIYEKVLQ